MYIADGVLYLRDVCLTLSAFLAARPAAAAALLGADAGLLSALAAVHDDLLPRLSSAVAKAPVQSDEPYSKASRRSSIGCRVIRV